jgi:hypothetical protein
MPSKDNPLHATRITCASVGVPADGYEYLDDLIYETVVKKIHANVVAVGNHLVMRGNNDSSDKELLDTVFGVLDTVGHDASIVKQVELYRVSSSHKQLVMATAMGQYDIVKEIIITEFLGNTDSIEKIPYFNVNATWVMDDEDADVEVN